MLGELGHQVQLLESFIVDDTFAVVDKDAAEKQGKREDGDVVVGVGFLGVVEALSVEQEKKTFWRRWVPG